MFFMQDCVCLVAPHSFRSEPFDEFNVTRDFDITGAGDVWYARPQLFFKCSHICEERLWFLCSETKRHNLVFSVDHFLRFLRGFAAFAQGPHRQHGTPEKGPDNQPVPKAYRK